MDALTLITDLEAEFSITVEDHQLLALQTVGDVVRLVDELRERGNTLANPAGAE
jgi:acyl carrier protein